MRLPVSCCRLCAVVLVVAGACRGRESIAPDDPGGKTAAANAARVAATSKSNHERELAALLAFEEQTRAATDFATQPPSSVTLGPDPYRIAELPNRAFYVGVLHDDSAIVVLDRDGTEVSRAQAPRFPSGLFVSPTGNVLVVGEGARGIAQFAVGDGKISHLGTIEVDALGMRDVALSPDGNTAYVTEERSGRILAVALDRSKAAWRATHVRELGRCHGPLQIRAIENYVATNCLLDHAIEIRRDRGEPVRIHHDGPMWSMAIARQPDGGALIAAGGVEDHPLVREDGGFGYIDSYLYLYRIAPGTSSAMRLAMVNTSALDAVTPKWVALEAGDGSITATLAGYATGSRISLHWKGPAATIDFTDPQVTTTAWVPGTSAAAIGEDGTVIAADPLLDAWVVQHRGDKQPRLVAASSAHRYPRSLESQIGELLFYTSMMAPWNSTKGKLSRFTCETCHHEGYVDGRTHFTGRGKVHATTRMLYGLFNNRPHFSRALDKTMAEMVHAEFRVANRHNGRDPWFSLTYADIPWLSRIDHLAHRGHIPDKLSPELLRKSFMQFLIDNTHRPNPAVLGREHFTALERTGARVFRERCSVCHAARLIAEDKRSTVPFENWEKVVLSENGPIVWSDAAYAKTSVTPYVNPRGTRIPTLRRLYKKWPYFTNGTAKSLDQLLDQYASNDKHVFHDGAPAEGVTKLSASDKAALRAFLDLL